MNRYTEDTPIEFKYSATDAWHRGTFGHYAGTRSDVAYVQDVNGYTHLVRTALIQQRQPRK